MQGKAYILQSGQKTTNDLVYGAKFTTLGYAKTTISIENVGEGSGVDYTIRGYPVEGFPANYLLGSGSVTVPGTLKVETLMDAWSQIDVGCKSHDLNLSGVVTVSSVATVYVAGKRR